MRTQIATTLLSLAACAQPTAHVDTDARYDALAPVDGRLSTIGPDLSGPCDQADTSCAAKPIRWRDHLDSTYQFFADTATFQELESYRLSTAKLIDCAIDDDQLVLTNWLPRDLDGLLLVGHYQGKTFELFEIDTAHGISELRLPLPWNRGVTRYQSVDDDTFVDLSSDTADRVTCDFSPQDDLQRAIKAHSVDWKVRFSDRVMNGKADVCRDGNVVWRPNRPQFCRYIWTFLVNASQTVAEPAFERHWRSTAFRNSDANIPQEYVLTREEYETYPKEEKITYNQDYLANGEYYNKRHRDRVYKQYRDLTLSVGSTGGGGLGGGSALGLNHTKIFEAAWTWPPSAIDAYDNDQWYLDGPLSATTSTPWNIMGHEAGHVLGYSHKSNYTTKSTYSHVVVGTIVYSQLLDSERAFVTADTMVGRDITWEAEYKKKAPGPERSRPRCGDAFEWGGAYDRHDVQMPQKGTPEWDIYIERHLKGEGLEYLKELNISPSTYYSWWTE